MGAALKMLYSAGGQAGLGELADRAERVGVTYSCEALDGRPQEEEGRRR